MSVPMEVRAVRVPTPTPFDAIFAKLPPIFREAFDPEDQRVNRPILIGGMAYVTNGHIAVRTAVNPEFAAEIEVASARTDGKANVDVNTVFEGRTEGDPIAIPDLPTDTPCPHCKGQGWTAESECSKCKGRGEVLCMECQHTHTCDDCHGQGTLGPRDCWQCAASGYEDIDRDEWDFVGAELAPQIILDWKYLRMLARHGVTQVFPMAKPEGKPIRFVAGDAEGILMTLWDGMKSRPITSPAEAATP